MKRSERQQSFVAGKAYLKIDSLVKTALHEFMAVARSGLWAPAKTNKGFRLIIFWEQLTQWRF